MEFGVTVLPDPPHTVMLDRLARAEANGFTYGWTYDSHVLWQECFPLLTAMTHRTSTMKAGLCVTNPGTREPTVLASAHATVHDISGGRVVLGVTGVTSPAGRSGSSLSEWPSTRPPAG
ncbi:MAG: LLM class flavin-dependent oxidoreductase [Actinomycetia bacterium]|nr:LLM class flavin-dependent oxidoreductase [Actinomycetes bacterium]